MNTESERKLFFVYWGGLAFLALVINLYFLAKSEHPTATDQAHETPLVRQTPVPQPAPVALSKNETKETERAAAAREAEKKAAAEHARFLARYLNRSTPRSDGMMTVAIVVSSEDGKLNNMLANRMRERLKLPIADISTSLFTPEFISDGLFASAFGGSSQVVNNLELAKILDLIVLGKQTVQYTKNPSFENTTTATMQFEITILSTSLRGQSQSWSFNASGIGFSETQARAMAEERIMKQIEKDNRISLTL